MPHRLRSLLVGMCVLLLAGVVCAQGGYITAADTRGRNDQLKALADELLATTDSQKRVEIRDAMLKLDTLKGQNGFAIDHFVTIYQKGLKKDRLTGRDDLNARLQAAIGVSSIDNPNTPRELGNMLSDPSEAIRLRVLKAIHDNAIIRTWEQVVPQLGDPNLEVQGWAAKTLGKLKQGADGKATEQLTALLVKTWNDLKQVDRSQTEKRSQLNSLIETVGRALEQLTGEEWKPGPETDQLPAAIERYTSWWNRKHSAALKDPRLGMRRDALQAMEKTADRTVANQLIEFMAQERQRWLNAPEGDKRQHVALLIKANAMLEGVSGMSASLSTTSSPDQVAGAIKRWSDWWAKEVNKMGTP